MTWRYKAYQCTKLYVMPLLRGRILSFEIHNPYIGFFAQLTWCSSVLEYCKQRGLTAQLSSTSPNYRDPARSANWLSYFFEVVDPGPRVDFRISQMSELCMPLRYLSRRTLEETSELVKLRLSLKQEILSKLERFCGEHFAGKKIVGVHYRGTDKVEEAPRVSWEAARETLANYLCANRDVNGLFVATDEPPFREYVADSFPELEVIHYGSSLAADGKADLGSNYAKGEGALMDCLLLSRCSAAIRTTSFLSAWASIFNPKLPIVLMNRPYPQKFWFPESLLISKSMNQYLPAALLPQSLPPDTRLR